MARMYSHRRSSSQKKAKPMEAFHAAAVSVFSMIVYIALVGWSVSTAGENTKWVGGFGILGFCVAIGAFIYNVGQMRTETDLKQRIICMSVSSVILLVWLATMVIGMFS